MLSKHRNLIPYLFLSVPVIIYLIWIIGPMIYTFYLSLTDWNGLVTPSFIGLENFEKLFRDKVFFLSLINNLKWLFVFITIPVVLGLGLAMALNQAIPGEKRFKMSFYMPMVLATVVSGLNLGVVVPSQGRLDQFHSRDYTYR